ncbi:hypothetical protein L1049_016099 [Liquidambar formosana]|uniref:Reverse transcriptase domain-containing protein n=1 Tax=Liquidambar formosana TaxID=63359 RepID=A0AAP0X2F3_LIQFO
MPQATSAVEERRAIMGRMDEVLVWEEILWKQCSRVSWLKEDDRNIGYFHARALEGRRKNSIRHLFTSSYPHHIKQILETMEKRVLDGMIATLMWEFCAEEVRVALSQMHPTKALGPDGMPTSFFQKYWHVVGPNVTNAALSFLNEGQMLWKLNYTHIILIPKIDSPENITQYRPISLCNVLYKIISKVLANRLKEILPHVFSRSQSAFLRRQLITDNVLVAFEIMHFLNNKRTGQQGQFALKLDMSKAYDRVEWSFLESIMVKMGFDSRWVNLIMSYVTTVSYSVIFNDNQCGNFRPSQASDRRSPLPISLSYCGRRLYGAALGQQTNMEKSSIFFSKNTSLAQQDVDRNAIGISSTEHHGKYLGLPTLISKSKKVIFNYIKERVWKRLQGWKGKLLSKAEKEVLIKVVVQAIPLHVMSCFKFPTSLCDELTSMISQRALILSQRDIRDWFSELQAKAREKIMAMRYLEEYIAAQSGSRTESRAIGARWLPPMTGPVKINVDATLFAENSSVGFGQWCKTMKDRL